eukprot:scpid5582/ scgid24178/ RUN and SH3 domain-containing protein 1
MGDENADLTKPPPHLEGVLLKQDPRGLMRGWKSRYFVVRKDNIFYYKSREESVSNHKYTGVIKLPEVEEINETTFSKVPKQSYVNCGFTLTVIGQDRVYSLLAEDKADCDHWVRGLKYVKRYWKAQDIYRTTVLNDDEITRRMIADEDEEDYIDSKFTVYGEGGDSTASPKTRRQSQTRPRSKSDTRRVMVHLTGGETKRVALAMDSTVENLLGLLSSSLMSTNCNVWQVNKEGVVRRLAKTEAIAPLKPYTDRFFCLNSQCRPLVVHFDRDEGFVATDVPDTITAFQVVELKCMTDKLAQLGVYSAGLFLRDSSAKDVLFANEDMPCKLLYDEDADGKPFWKTSLGHLVMHNKRQFDSPSLRPSQKPIHIAVNERKKREEDASMEEKQRELLKKIDQDRQIKLQRDERRKADEFQASQAAREAEGETDGSGEWFPREEVSQRRLSRRKQKSKKERDPEDTPFEIVNDFYSGDADAGDDLTVTEASLMSPPSEGSEDSSYASSQPSRGSTTTDHAQLTADSVRSSITSADSARDSSALSSSPESHAEEDSGSVSQAAAQDMPVSATSAEEPSPAASGASPSLRRVLESPDSAAIVSSAGRSAVRNRGSLSGNSGGSGSAARSTRVRFSLDLVEATDIPSDADAKAHGSCDEDDEERGEAHDHDTDDDDNRSDMTTPSSVSSMSTTDESEQQAESDSDSDTDDEWHRMQDDELNDLVTKPLDLNHRQALKGVLSRGRNLNASRRNKDSRRSFGDFDEKHLHRQEMEARKNKPPSDDTWQVVDSFDKQAAAEAARRSVRRHTLLQSEAPTPAQAAGAAVGQPAPSSSTAASASSLTGSTVQRSNADKQAAGSDEKKWSRNRSVRVDKRRSPSMNDSQVQSTSPSQEPEVDEETKRKIEEDQLIKESRSSGFGERPMLTLNGVHEHNQEMERVSALLDRQQQVDKEHSDKERRLGSVDPDQQIESLQAKLEALQKGKAAQGPSKAHRPLPVDISRLLPATLSTDGGATATGGSGSASVTTGRALPITNPARLKSVLMQSKQSKDASHKSYSRMMDFISLSGTLLRNTGGKWHLETGSSYHNEMNEDTEDHVEVFKIPGGIRAAYNHTQKCWCVRPTATTTSSAGQGPPVVAQPVPIVAMPVSSDSSLSATPVEAIPVGKTRSDSAGVVKAFGPAPVFGKSTGSGPPVTAQPVAMPTKAAQTTVEARRHTAATPSNETTVNTYAMKERLVKGALGSTEQLLAHFSSTREADKKHILGDDGRTPSIGHFVRGTFCTSIASVMSNGLRPTRLGGFIVNSLWDVVVAASNAGSSLVSQPAQDAVEDIKAHPAMIDSNMKYRTFLCLALTHSFLEPWLDHLRQQDDVLRKYYFADSFLSLARGQCAGLYDTLLLTIQPLAELPFKLHIAFEAQHLHAANEAKRQESRQKQEEQHRQPHTTTTTATLDVPDGGKDSSGSPRQSSSPVPFTATAFVNGGSIGKRGASPSVAATSSMNGSMEAPPSSSAESNHVDGASSAPASSFSNKMLSRFKQAVASIQTSESEAGAENDWADSANDHDESSVVTLDSLKQRFTAVREKSKQAIVGLKMKLSEPEEHAQMDNEQPATEAWIVEALYTNMTDATDELEFDAGARLEVIEQVNDDWLVCRLGDREGLVATNYVTDVPG